MALDVLGINTNGAPLFKNRNYLPGDAEKTGLSSINEEDKGTAFLPKDIVSISKEAEGKLADERPYYIDYQSLKELNEQQNSQLEVVTISKEDIDYFEESHNQILASSAFKANIAVIQKKNELLEHLLNKVVS